ncbi:VCBS repeat-containing protein [Streptomyces sp. NPDC013455]|uniref:FG-GAP repeat domain-containing protein n=1 Tax=Streptomyces sp. NPDC013455 TaxID=3155605 RepID=UPI0033F3E4F1
MAVPGGRSRARRLARAAWIPAGFLLLAGCEDSLGRPPLRPTGPPAVTACLTGQGDLIADVNNDGHPDRVADPSHRGALLTITFGVGTARQETVTTRELADRTAGRQPYVRAAVADFDRDGWSDLLVVAGQEQRGDDPVPPRVAELRLGPFSNTGRGRRVVPLHLGATKDIVVADHDHDSHPDVTAYTYSGDGTYAFVARLGDEDTGLRSDGGAYGTDQDGTGYRPTDRLPHSGLSPFYPACHPRGPAG